MYKPVFGKVIIHIKTTDMLQLMHDFKKHDIEVTHLTQYDSNRWQFSVPYQQEKKTMQLLTVEAYSFEVIKYRGILLRAFLIFTKKEIILPLIFSVLILWTLSNIVWKVDTTQVNPMLESLIQEELENAGLYRGAWKPSLPSNEHLKLHMMDNIESAQHINIYHEGTTFFIEAELKETVLPPPAAGYQHLIASKNGVIEKFAVQEGEIKKAIHDVVKKGDLLVSGKITADDEEEKDVTFVRAKGAVYATTWYEVKMSSPLLIYDELLSGKYFHRYYISVADYMLPIWGRLKAPFPAVEKTSRENEIKLFNWTLPFTWIEERNYEKKQREIKNAQKETRKKMLQYISTHLHTKLGKNVDIKKYYVLHEDVHNGKVNMNLYISVRENIAEAKAIKK